LILRRASHHATRPAAPGFLARLLRDRGGNTLMLVAAAIVPIMAMIGGGVDMGRNYLAESRLQQACDAGVLAARKALGSATVVDAATETKVSNAGSRFFNVNFADGAYGSENRHFAMVLNNDLTIDGTATADMPTTIMQMFGYDNTPLEAHCTAKLSVANTDVMMALDVTGSMNETPSGDSQSKISTLKQVVKSFYTQLEANKVVGSRTRYGFVPYSTNVNVGSLLKDDWVVSEWTYQSRDVVGSLTASGTYGYYTGASPVSGTYATTTASTYAATAGGGGTYSCPTKPANTATQSSTLISTTTQAVTTPLPGTRTTYTYDRTTSGDRYAVSLSGTTCTVTKTTYTSYVDRFAYITEPALASGNKWQYMPVTRDVSGWRSESNGCIEERDTYDITDYDDVDLTKALDLDIDLVPTAGDEATQWRPQYPSIIYDRAIPWSGSGSWNTGHVTTSTEYVAPWIGGFAACPPKAQKLKAMTVDEIDTYIGGLSAAGSTYHDIGMIWAGRLISPTGIFASENADAGGLPTSRNLIFLTDGQTSSLDLSYGAYGVEPLDKRRWSPSGSSYTLTQTVEKRFSFACEEVKKKNVTVWFIAFGTDLNPIMTECAGAGHYFSASNAEELDEVFSKIAKSIGQLRLSL
jgi:Flp pilus assembly protein TadG